MGDHELTIKTNGHFTAMVFDTRTGDVVGGYWGAQRIPLITFAVFPGDHTTIPLLVGTVSFVPELGYTVPAGLWAMATDLHLGDGRVVRSPSLPLTIT